MSEPRWVRVVAVVPALALATFGAVGLLLADLGIYRAWLVLLLGGAGLVALAGGVRPLLLAESDAGRAEHVTAAGAVGFSVVSALWNATNASQHVQIDRDGGRYLNAGRWIAAHGTLNLRPFVGAFAPVANAASRPALVATSTGMTQRGSHLEFDVPHLLPALLAEAHGLGGNRMMFLAVPLLSAFALITFYLLAARLLPHPLAALGATVTLAWLMPQVAFSRDSTTEVPFQILLFAALWLLCDPRTLRSAGPAFAAGLLLGLLAALRLDGLAALVGLPPVAALTWWRADRADRARMRESAVWLAAGVGDGLLLAVLDLVRWDWSSVHVLAGDFVRLVLVQALAAAAVAGAVVVARRTAVVDMLRRTRAQTGLAAGVLVAVVGFAAWLVRPLVQHSRGRANAIVAFVQRYDHLAIDPTRRYSELAVRWISWYVGPITLTIAIVGAGLLVAALVRGTVDAPVRIAALMLAPPALLYIWQPSTSPDQIWAARQLLPAVFPVVILLTFGVLAAIAGWQDAEYGSLARSLVVVLSIATILAPWLTIRDVSQMTVQRGLFGVVTDTCKLLGPRSAVVMLPESTSVAALSDPQTLRSFCDVPVVVVAAPRPNVLVRLAARWKADGRTLFAVAEFSDTLRRVLPRTPVRSTAARTNPHLLEPTLTRRPSHYVREILQLSVARVPLPTARSG